MIEQTLAPGANYSRYVVSYLSDGYRIYTLMTVPNGPVPETGWPAIIFNHGYIPPAQYRTTERYVAYPIAIARSGYIVFKSDYRGHGSSEGPPEGAYGYPGYTDDVLNTLASVKAYGDADPNRIGMWGHSLGGQLTLRRDGRREGHQGRRDLGRRGGALSEHLRARPQPAAAHAHGHRDAHPTRRHGPLRPALAPGADGQIRLGGAESSVLGVYLAQQLSG